MKQKNADKKSEQYNREPLDAAFAMHPSANKILLENRQFLIDLIENSGTLIVIKDLEGKYLLVNHKWEEVTGLKRESVLGKTDAVLFSPEMARQFRENDLHVIQTGSSMEAEERLETPSGMRYFISNKFPLLDGNGAVAGLYGVFTEITRLKQVEKQLHENQKKYHSLFDRAQAALFRTSIDGQLLEISKRYAERAGFSSVEQCMAEYVPGNAWADPIEREKMLQILREKGSVSDYEAEIIRRDGKHIWILFSATLYPEHGYLEGSVVEITDRKQAEIALKKSEAFQRKMVANIGDVIVIVDRDGINRYKSPNIEKMFGWKPEELVGASAWDNVHPEDLAVSREFFESLIREPESVGTIEIRYKCKDGNYKWMEFTGSNLLDDPDIRGVLGNYHDIVERKRTEKEREKLQDQLTQAQKMESVGRLAGGVAHDYNNMLSVILGYTEMALEKVPYNDSLRTDLQEIYKAAKRSSEITQQLLAFARKQAIAPKALDLNAVIEKMLNMLRRLIGEDIDVIWHPGRRLSPVKIDPSQFEQILANLCVNARDAISGVGKIIIETQMASIDEENRSDFAGDDSTEFVKLSVSDDGCGMDKETLKNIFEPFFTTKGVAQGTGLGLATVYGIVRQNNGVIEVDSEPGCGSTFNIYLPRHMGDAEAMSSDGVPEIPVGEGEVVLLVEDEPTVSEMCQAIFDKLGYRVLSADTPEEALQMADEHPGEIDLLVTDVVMPGMNGRELTQQIQALYPDIKALYMSGYTADVIANRGVLEKEVQFIQKPFSVKDLAIKVKKTLKNA
jgi:PAS domain S-box-containing protein